MPFHGDNGWRIYGTSDLSVDCMGYYFVASLMFSETSGEVFDEFAYILQGLTFFSESIE